MTYDEIRNTAYEIRKSKSYKGVIILGIREDSVDIAASDLIEPLDTMRALEAVMRAMKIREDGGISLSICTLPEHS